MSEKTWDAVDAYFSKQLLGPDSALTEAQKASRAAPKHADVARKNIANAGLDSVAEVRVGRGIDLLPKVAAAKEGPFDLVFIDADKPSYVGYYEAVLPKLADKGLIVADNVLWSGRVLDQDPDESTSAIQAFNDHVARDSRVVCVMLTVRDGMTLIRKR
jgi:caffeoyl-CoA O-methyltransferase